MTPDRPLQRRVLDNLAVSRAVVAVGVGLGAGVQHVADEVIATVVGGPVFNEKNLFCQVTVRSIIKTVPDKKGQNGVT